MRKKINYEFVFILFLELIGFILLSYQVYSGFFNGQVWTKFGDGIPKGDEFFYVILLFYVFLLVVVILSLKPTFKLAFIQGKKK